jgi:hypothetical protein
MVQGGLVCIGPVWCHPKEKRVNQDPRGLAAVGDPVRHLAVNFLGSSLTTP